MKDTVISGVKPSGEIHLGTLCGSILQFVKYQDIYDLNIFIADIHALTKPIKPELLKKYTRDLISTYLAAGLDPQKVNLFKQSDCPEHAQLSQILTCYLDVPDLTKMPQYKNYVDTHPNEATPAGMLDYVNWMNADILLYSETPVKVICGQDQLPHIYLCQEVAKRFNKIYGLTFNLPEPVMAESGAKIMSLSNPTKKMSKSESDKGTVYLDDDDDTIRKKFKKAVADSEGKIYYDPENKPGISNLLNILSNLTNVPIKDLEEFYKDEHDYGKFKEVVAETVIEKFHEIKDRRETIIDDYIKSVLSIGGHTVRLAADKMLSKVYNKIGLK